MTMPIITSNITNNSFLMTSPWSEDCDQNAEDKDKSIVNPFGNAFEIYLTEGGKKVNSVEDKNRQLSEDKLTEAEEKLKKLAEEDKEARLKKEKIALLEEKLAKAKLDPEDKKNIEGEVIRLHTESDTAADRMSTYYQEKRLAESKLNDQNLSPAERAILKENISLYEEEIEDLKLEFKKRIEEQINLRLKAVEERAELDLQKQKEDTSSTKEKDIRIRPVTADKGTSIKAQNTEQALFF